jgi:hypothetical protein
MIAITLTIIGLCLAGSGIYQINKPTISIREYEMQVGFILVGIIFVSLGLSVFLL